MAKTGNGEQRQLAAWRGGFGDEYAGRNSFSAARLEDGLVAFRRMLGRRRIGSVLEVGSNIGLNLRSLHELYRGRVALSAVEPNRKAFRRLKASRLFRLERAENCSVFDMPFEDASFDLVFTSGVLIHVPPADLGSATDEVVRVSRRWVLCVEYFSHEPVEKAYRGREGLLFKRDFGSFYLERHPALVCEDYGFLWQRELPGFDDLNWWLFRKA